MQIICVTVTWIYTCYLLAMFFLINTSISVRFKISWSHKISKVPWLFVVPFDQECTYTTKTCKVKLFNAGVHLFTCPATSHNRCEECLWRCKMCWPEVQKRLRFVERLTRNYFMQILRNLIHLLSIWLLHRFSCSW